MAALVLATLALGGCRMEVTARLDLRPDGGGTAALDVFLDRELMGLLDELGVDAVAEVEAAAADAGEWDVEVAAEGVEGLRLRLDHEGPDPAAALGDLSAGLAEGDPGLWADLTVETRAGGGAAGPDAAGHDELALEGEARLGAPAPAGAVASSGAPLGPGREELERLVEEHVEASLAVRMPGRVAAHDADEVADGLLRWRLPVEEPVRVTARSEVRPRPWWPVAAAAAGVLVVGALAVALLLRRRRAASREGPGHGGVTPAG